MVLMGSPKTIFTDLLLPLDREFENLILEFRIMDLPLSLRDSRSDVMFLRLNFMGCLDGSVG